MEINSKRKQIIVVETDGGGLKAAVRASDWYECHTVPGEPAMESLRLQRKQGRASF